MDPHKNAQLIFDKDVIQWKKNQLFQQMVLEQVDINRQPERYTFGKPKSSTLVLKQNKKYDQHSKKQG